MPVGTRITARKALEVAVASLTGGDVSVTNRRQAVRWLEAMLEQEGCREMGISPADTLPETIAVIIDG